MNNYNIKLTPGYKYKVTSSSGGTQIQLKYSKLNDKYLVIYDEATYNTKLKSEYKYKVTASSGGIQVPAKFGDLDDYNPTNLNDRYLIMYDAATQTYIPVNPDEILSAAITDPISPGLPANFQNQLSVDLDNKIDLDAGTF